MRAARAAFFPAVQLTSQGGIESLALSSLLGPGSLIFTAAASVTQTIFDNGLKQGDLDQAKGRFAELVADYRQATLQAFQDAETYLTAVRYAAQQEDLERKAVAVAQRAEDIARAQLAAGTVDITTVLNTQNTLFADEDTFVQVRLAHFQALINLYKVLGGRLGPPGLDRNDMTRGRILLVLLLLGVAGARRMVISSFASRRLPGRNRPDGAAGPAPARRRASRSPCWPPRPPPRTCRCTWTRSARCRRSTP